MVIRALEERDVLEYVARRTVGGINYRLLNTRDPPGAARH